jgi:hypothetical protein
VRIFTVLLIPIAVTVTACSGQVATNVGNESQTQSTNNSNPARSSSPNANSSASKNTKLSLAPSQSAPKISNNSGAAEAGKPGCPEAKIPLCRELAQSRTAPLGPGGTLEGKPMDEGLQIIKECYELKQRGCF